MIPPMPKFETHIHNPVNVLFIEDRLIILEGKTYKIVNMDGTTITVQLSFWDRLSGYFLRLRWKLLEWYDDILET